MHDVEQVTCNVCGVDSPSYGSWLYHRRSCKSKTPLDNSSTTEDNVDFPAESHPSNNNSQLAARGKGRIRATVTHFLQICIE